MAGGKGDFVVTKEISKSQHSLGEKNGVLDRVFKLGFDCILDSGNRRFSRTLRIGSLKIAFSEKNVRAIEMLLRLGATPVFESPAFNELCFLREEIVSKVKALFGRRILRENIGFIFNRVFEFLRADLVKDLCNEKNRLGF